MALTVGFHAAPVNVPEVNVEFHELFTEPAMGCGTDQRTELGEVVVTVTSAQKPVPQSDEMRAVAVAGPDATAVLVGVGVGVAVGFGVADALGVGLWEGSGGTDPPAPVTKAREYAHCGSVVPVHW